MSVIEYRFRPGQTVYVLDGEDCELKTATVREQHYHPERHPSYPNGEGYSLDGMLWWDCYPGCRVFESREEAENAKPALLAVINEERTLREEEEQDLHESLNN